MPNPYSDAAAVVSVDYKEERENAVRQGASASRLAHLDASIRIAERALSAMESASTKDEALAAVKFLRDEVDSSPDPDRRTNEARISACIVVRAAIEKLA